MMILSGSHVYAANILVWGDSLSAGYGISIEQAWPSLLQTRLDTAGLAFKVINGSVSGETTAGGLSRLPAALTQHKPGILILELGANDGLRGLPVAQMQDNLSKMVALGQKSGAKVLLIGIKMPPNLGPVYANQFNASYPALAQKLKVPLIPFIFEGFADQLDQFQADGLHPTAAAQPKILETVWPGLKPLLK